MADKKKKPKKKPDGRGQRPRDPNQLALWIVEQSTSPTPTDQEVSLRHPRKQQY
jgi:hypothetical protein